MVKKPDADMATEATPEQAASAPAEEDITLLDLAIVLAKHKYLVLGLPLLAAVITAVYSLSLSPVYTATTKILPPQQGQSAATALAGQLGALVGLGGAPSVRNTNELYVAMLTSRTIADVLIGRFGLHQGSGSREGTRKALANATIVKAGRDGLITISFEDTDRKRAAILANAYVEELYKLNQSLAVTEASQRRLFFEQQLKLVRDNLAQAEHAARQALERGGIVQVEGHGRAILEATARLRGQISVKEIQLSAMRTFATEHNPEYTMALRELDAMKRELVKLEGGGPVENAAGASDKGIDSFRLLRNVKYYETMYELLAKQYEVARIDEAKDSSLIQVLDAAIEPESKSRPRRTFMVLVAGFCALAAAVLLVFAIEWLRALASRPDEARRLTMLKRYLAIR